MALYIYTENDVLRELLEERANAYRPTDSGFDIPMMDQGIDMLETKYTFDLGIKIAAADANDLPRPCLILPRSSLSNTSFRLSNSIGLIDMGYRGIVKAKVDILQNNEQFVEIPRGTRYFQICRHNFMPWTRIIVVSNIDHLPPASDDRGEGGFGSTGLQ